MKDVHRLVRFGVRFEDSPNRGFVVHHISVSSLLVKFKSKKHIDQPLMELKDSIMGKRNESFSLRRDGVLRYQGRLCVPNVTKMGNQILPFIWVLQRCIMTIEKCFGGKA